MFCTRQGFYGPWRCPGAAGGGAAPRPAFREGFQGLCPGLQALAPAMTHGLPWRGFSAISRAPAACR